MAVESVVGDLPEICSPARQLASQISELTRVSQERRDAIDGEVATTGTYRQTLAELAAGSKIAWRNHARCNGRMHWRSLQIRDCREADTVQEVFEHCLEHLRVSTNGGALRAVLSVFAQSSPDGRGWSVLNPQLVRYAGYRRSDGSVVGDPLHLHLTTFARHLGWRSPGGQFDVLPLLIRDPSGQVHLRDLPAGSVLEVPIAHPQFPQIGELGLRWHANPAVSDKILSIGSLNYPLAPFSGWYVSSEIGARNLSDVDRYDKLPAVATAMGLDTRRDDTLWKDRAIIELTYAVQHSFRSAGVHIVDHHTASRQFVDHVQRESRLGRDTPTDWSWINPPVSASTTPTFHRTYSPANFELRPNFVARTADGPFDGCPVHS